MKFLNENEMKFWTHEFVKIFIELSKEWTTGDDSTCCWSRWQQFRHLSFMKNKEKCLHVLGKRENCLKIRN